MLYGVALCGWCKGLCGIGGPSAGGLRGVNLARGTVGRCGWGKGLRGIGGLPAGGVRGANLTRGAVGRFGVKGLYPRRA